MLSIHQFKHVNGRDGKVESICMKCLLAVGICSSDEELTVRESRHVCKGETEALKLVQVKCRTTPESLVVWSWNRIVAGLPRKKRPRLYWPEITDE